MNDDWITIDTLYHTKPLWHGVGRLWHLGPDEDGSWWKFRLEMTDRLSSLTFKVSKANICAFPDTKEMPYEVIEGEYERPEDAEELARVAPLFAWNIYGELHRDEARHGIKTTEPSSDVREEKA